MIGIIVGILIFAGLLILSRIIFRVGKALHESLERLGTSGFSIANRLNEIESK